MQQIFASILRWAHGMLLLCSVTSELIGVLLKTLSPAQQTRTAESISKSGVDHLHLCRVGTRLNLCPSVWKNCRPVCWLEVLRLQLDAVPPGSALLVFLIHLVSFPLASLLNLSRCPPTTLLQVGLS